MPELTFDEENHIYRLDDLILLSVTQVLKAEGYLNTYKNFNNFNMTRGTYVHKMIELYLKKDLDEATLDPQLTPYLIGFKDFSEKTALKTLVVEKLLYHKIYHYAGTPDLVAIIKPWSSADRGNVLIDIKAGVPSPWHDIQLGAYYDLLYDNGFKDISGAFNLYLADDETWHLGQEIHLANLRHLATIFRGAHESLKYKLKRGIIKLNDVILGGC